MRPIMMLGLTGGCLIALVLACTGEVLVHDRQFSYRDAGEYYYPLQLRIQQEWEAGRWPLWEPEENGGMPLLGNPAAAVFYPGKIIYVLLPYAWSARIYVIAHLVLAFATTLALLRSWRVSWTGSSLGAIAYAFGAPVLFQYSNVIYLVGAAWTPLGLRSIDRLVRLGKRAATLELAAVLALQVLGGDPEAAYLVVANGGLYAFVMAWREVRQATDQGEMAPAHSSAFRIGLCALVGTLAWVGSTLVIAGLTKSNHARFPTRYLRLDQTWHAMILLLVWGGIASLAWVRGSRRLPVRTLMKTLAALSCAVAIALALSAVQVLPAAECSRLSVRAADTGLHDIYAFSIEPYRVVEWLWPGVFGSYKHGERNWHMLVPGLYSPKTWTPSLYLGGLTVVLSLGAIGVRGGPPWRVWLTIMAVVSFAASLGQFASPVWWAREFAGARQTLGTHDPADHEPPRSDGGVADGDGSPYWVMAALLPGFGSFRYPAKLLTFTSIAMAALAGIGWDRWHRGGRSRAPAAFLLLSLCAWVSIAAAGDRLVRQFAQAGQGRASLFGPFDPRGAVADLRRGLGHGAIAMAAATVVAWGAKRRKGWAAPAAVVLLTTDLAVANADLVVSVPQAMFDGYPGSRGSSKRRRSAIPLRGRSEFTACPCGSPGPCTGRTRTIAISR